MPVESVYQTPTSDLTSEPGDEVVYAGFWIRVLANILDGIFYMIIAFPLLTAIYGMVYWESEEYTLGVWDFLISNILPIIIVITFWVYKSATPGKMVLGLEIISLGENKKLSVGQAIGRYFAYIPAYLVFFLGIIWVAFDKRKQGWHDKLASTAVIKKHKRA